MGTYIDFENNSEVTDVLFQIISGTSSVKDIVKNLKQPQSTVSSKLQFLRDVGAVNKTRWEYKPNYNKLVSISGKVFKKIIRDEIRFRQFNKEYVSSEKKEEIENSVEELKEIAKKSYVSKHQFKKILETASWFYPSLDKKVSVRDVIESFYFGLIGTEEKIEDEKLHEMKDVLGKVHTKDELFFLSVIKNRK
jgi:hypothetical protein